MRYCLHTFMTLVFFFVSLCTTFSQPADSTQTASDKHFSWERFTIRAGGFITTIQSDVSVGIQHGLGVNINLEDALGLSTRFTVVRGNVDYRFGKRNRSAVHAGYFSLVRRANKLLETDVEVGDFTFPIGTEVKSEFGFTILQTSYEYTFLIDERVRMGALAGIYVMPMKLSVAALGGREEATEFIAPLPVAGLHTVFRLTPRLSILQNIQLLYLSFSNFSGSITDANIWLDYNPWDHFGFGIGYNSFRFRFSVNGSTRLFDELEGSFQTGFSGLLVYAKYSF